MSKKIDHLTKKELEEILNEPIVLTYDQEQKIKSFEKMLDRTTYRRKIDKNNEIKMLENKIEELKDWVNDLQSGMYINCVYCGHRYGPKINTPVSISSILTEHIEKCPEHPMNALKRKNEQIMEWCFKALVALAKRNLNDIVNSNGEWLCEKNWEELNDNSRISFMKKARKEARISDDDYLKEIRTGDYSVNRWIEETEGKE